jgi:hypothetical protein
MNRIQFQAGMSLSQFLELYGTEKQCEAEPSSKPAGQMDFAVPNAVSRSMVLCMGVASGAISAGAAVIRQLSLQEQSWKPLSCRLPSGSKHSTW